MNESSRTTETEPKETRITAGPDTRAKLDRIRGVKRWSMTVAIDALADHFLATDPQMRGDVPAVGQPIDKTA